MINKSNLEDYTIKFFITDKDTRLIFSGSGFIINHNKNCYLVSTRHNVFKDDGSFIGPNLTIIQYNIYPNQLKLNFDINILKENNNINENIEKDIVLINIGSFNKEVSKIKYFDGREFLINTFDFEDLSEIRDDQIFSEIYMTGYPFSLIEQDQYLNFRPVTRKGIISNIDNINKYLLSDILSIQGDSGSPVYKIIESNVALIGLLKNTLNKPGGLGFSLIITIEVIKDLLIKST